VTSHHFHVITPLGRIGNFRPMLAHLSSFKGVGLTWHVVFDEFWSGRLKFYEPWIKAYCCPEIVPDWFMGYFKINWALDHMNPPGDQQRVLFLNDDDFLAPDYFDHVDAAKGDLLITTMRRGDHFVGRHECSTLEPKSESMKVGSVASEQLVLSGKLVRDTRIGPAFEADGMLIEKLCAEHDPVFVPAAEVWFNYLEPGRWDSAKGLNGAPVESKAIL
jgi:hypothetical protein